MHIGRGLQPDLTMYLGQNVSQWAIALSSFNLSLLT